jgi:hypothetical protein
MNGYLAPIPTLGHYICHLHGLRQETLNFPTTGNIATSSTHGDSLYAGTNYANPHAATSINGVTLTYDNNSI